MGLFKKLGQWRKSRAAQKQVRGQEKTIGNRICRFEPLEERRVLDAAPLYAGVVYIEEDLGSDLHGDTFEVSFTGGAEGTQLTRIVIDGDKGVPGYSSGDMIFDTIKEKMVDGKLEMTVGADEGYPFKIISANGIESVIATVDDSGSKLILDFVGFDAGEKLVFSIDVDEIQDFTPGTTDPILINDGVDPVASGAEFHNSLLTVQFKAEHYHDITGTGQFKNKYDDNFAGTGLPLPADNDGGKRDRTAGAVVPLQQQPLPITIAGRVWLDSNLNLTQEQAENGIANVSLSLWKKEGSTFVDTGITTATNAQGDYIFGLEHNLLPGTYQVRETQPTGLFSVGAVPGQVAGANVGSIVTGNPDVLTEITVAYGGQHAVHYNFGEAQAAQISGHVYHDRNNNGIKEAGEEGIANATLQVIPLSTISPQGIITVTTDANGFYQAVNLPPGTYRVVETQPNGWLDGLDAAGTVGGVVRGAATNPGDQIGTVALYGGDAGINYNFGELKSVEIHGRVQYTDRDGNCFVAEGPTPRPIEGAKVMLKDAQGNILATTFTNAAGEYSFVGLPPGTYTVVEETPVGLIDAGDHIGKVNGALNGTKPTDAFGNIINDMIANIVLASGQIGQRYDFCESIPAQISGHVYHDLDNDGVRDVGEAPIANATITLLGNNGVLLSTVTDNQGYYQFTGLVAGTYTVIETQPGGWLDGKDAAGTVAGVVIGSAVNPGDTIGEVQLKWGDTGVNYDFGELLPAAISGYVYHDRDNDGNREAGEEGLSGVLIKLVPVNADSRQGEMTILTNASGYYEFTGLYPGEYRVIEVVQPPAFFDGLDAAGTVGGVTRGSAHNPGDEISVILLSSGDRGIEYNFGEIGKGSIGGRVHLTTPEGDCYTTDPVNNPNVPLQGVVIKLYDEQGNLVAQTTTDAKGEYLFTDLAPGKYSIEEFTPAGLLDGGDHVGTINGIKVGERTHNDYLTNITLGSGEHGVHYDFCESLPAELSGHVYHDRDNDGVRDAGEEAIPGAVVRLYGSNGAVVAETTTNNFGYYQFTGLRADNYEVREVQPTGWLDGKDAAGTIAGVTVGSALNPGDKIVQVNLKYGQTGVNYDFGELLPGSIRGYVLGDKDFDCEFDEGETMIAGVKMQLLDAGGNVVAETLTDANGEYYFGDLMPGQYSVRQIQPNGYFTQAEHIGQVTEDGLFVGPGSGNTSTNLLSGVNIGSNQDLVNYYFCETTPAKISGYVFIDGAPILAQGGLTPNNVPLYSNGQLTPDDTRLANVWLELRNGITGEPIDGSQALPGTYPPGPIRVKTDANGYYEFDGLKSGNYAVFQIQPENLIDGIDTPGTLSGIAINAGDPLSPALATLTVGHNNDAILRIALTPGAHSQENNFSEVQSYKRPPEVFVPPPREEFLPPSVYSPPPMYPRNLPEYPQDPRPIFSSGGAIGYTWHLSVTNAGQPRGLREHVTTEATVWLTGVSLDQTALGSAKLQQGDWTMSIDPLTGKTVKRGFGMPGAIPIAGDFNGDGVAEMGVFYKGEWFVDLNGNGIWDKGDMWAKLGTDGDLPVVGDWDGDGKDDIGIFGPAWPGDPKAIAAEPGLPDPQNVPTGDMKNLPPKIEDATLGRRLLVVHPSHSRIRADLIDHVFHYGVSADKPVAGDWNGEGIRTIGVFRDGAWHLDMDGDGKFTPADKVVQFGKHGDLPVVGDWSGTGRDQLGVYRDGTWILDTNGNLEIDATDKVYELGGPGDQPVVGDWTGSGRDQIGIYRDAPAASKDRIGSLPAETR